MSTAKPLWDYLVITASNEAQAQAYRSQLERRQQLGCLTKVNQVLVVADPEGKRVGSGGSTLYCLIQIINRETQSRRQGRDWFPLKHLEDAVSVLRQQRILIIHAGGDSRRLPAYGPCGKIFVPVSDEGNQVYGQTIFDRLAPIFLELPPTVEGEGQVVIASGDALILFDPAQVRWPYGGLTALTCADTPEHASKHGVFIEGTPGTVTRYLQKPRPAEQVEEGAVTPLGQSLLDIGIMSFDASMAGALFQAFDLRLDQEGLLDWPPETRQLMLTKGVDFYREVCCAMGVEATATHHCQQARRAGSPWTDQDLGKMYQSLRTVPFHLHILPQAQFLHFGTTRQLITSGMELRQRDRKQVHIEGPLLINNRIEAGGEVKGHLAWVEGCRIKAPLILAGHNAAIGLDISEPLQLPEGACLDVLLGRNRSGQPVWFVRSYGMADSFKDPVQSSATFCNQPMGDWLAKTGLEPGQVWDPVIPETQRTLWNARVFPAVAHPEDYRRWLWIFDPTQATPEQKKAYREADCFSSAEILEWADQPMFFKRREVLRAGHDHEK